MNNLFAEFFEIGTLDMLFIERELKNFEVAIQDVRDKMSELGYYFKSTGGDFVNALLFGLYRVVVDEAEINEDEIDVNIYTNCIDSHLTVDGESIYNKEDLDRVVKEFKSRKEYHD